MNFQRLEKFLINTEDNVFPETDQNTKWNYINNENIDIVIDMFKTITNISLIGLKILDIGFGSGSELELFKKEGANIIGININDKDFNIVKENGFEIYKMFQEFMEFNDNIFDVVWSRHCLEHSIMPYYTLHEYKRVTKNGGYLYIEVPAPDTKLNHQNSINHYSVLTKSMWISLMKRTGFKIISSGDLPSRIITNESGSDLYYQFILRKENV